MTDRTLARVIESVPATDGAGVKLRRSLGRSPRLRVDPFLMLDAFSSDDPNDYSAGFPSHPHRGFETVTYMLDGHMRHEDHLGNRGDLGPGGVQWMTAGRGIIHSEMPLQLQGRMRGFQLWLNLPAREKMKPAHYRDIAADEIPLVALPSGGRVKVIAGEVAIGGRAVRGAVSGVSTDPLYLDVELPAGAQFAQTIAADHDGFVYPYEGSVRIAGQALASHNAGVLSRGDRVEVVADGGAARFLLLAARPIGEPIAQYGPFVMNTEDELARAVQDYREGKLTA